MKQNRGYPQLTVTKRAEHSIIKGHPWVYYNEITAEQPFADGELVDVVSQKGSYLGTRLCQQQQQDSGALNFPQRQRPL